MATHRCHENGLLGRDARDSGLRSGLHLQRTAAAFFWVSSTEKEEETRWVCFVWAAVRML